MYLKIASWMANNIDYDPTALFKQTAPFTLFDDMIIWIFRINRVVNFIQTKQTYQTNGANSLFGVLHPFQHYLSHINMMEGW